MLIAQRWMTQTMTRILLAAAIAATLAACAAPNPYVPPAPIQRPAFPEAEYQALRTTGTATVTGQVFLKTRGGDVKVGAGNPVYLNPVTSYSTFAWTHHKEVQGMTEPDPRIHKYMRTTTADGSGRFSFKDVPAGRYYVTGLVSWEAPQAGRLVRQGGTIWKEITIKDGEAIEVMVTQ